MNYVIRVTLCLIVDHGWPKYQCVAARPPATILPAPIQCSLTNLRSEHSHFFKGGG